MQPITKLCADSLRSFTQDTYGITLKASHAHELIAAFLGYNTKAALLADTKYPISNLEKAEFIVFDADNLDYANQRYIDFGYPHPTAYQLAEHFRLTIRKEESLAAKFQYSFREVAIEIAKVQLDIYLESWRMAPNSMEWEIDGHFLYFNNEEAILEAWINYPTNTGEMLRHSSYEIKLPRIAANLGYGSPKVVATTYAGETRKFS